jgi:hypothetical protein
MQFVFKGEHPGKSSLLFLPMIDLSPSDPTCIYSTLTYVSKHAEKHNSIPIITFDQPLYWKALMIILSEPEESKLKTTVLKMGGYTL